MDKFTVLWNSLPSKPLFLVVAFFWLTSWLFQAEVFPYFSSMITIPFTFLGGLVTVLLLSLWFVKAVESSLNVPNFVPILFLIVVLLINIIIFNAGYDIFPHAIYFSFLASTMLLLIASSFVKSKLRIGLIGFLAFTIPLITYPEIIEQINMAMRGTMIVNIKNTNSANCKLAIPLSYIADGFSLDSDRKRYEINLSHDAINPKVTLANEVNILALGMSENMINKIKYWNESGLLHNMKYYTESSIIQEKSESLKIEAGIIFRWYDKIFLSPIQPPGFMFVCSREDDGDCARVPIKNNDNKLIYSYSFKKNELSSWGEIEKSIEHKLNSMLIGCQTP